LGLIGAFCASEGIRKDTGIISWIRWPAMVVIRDAVAARSDVKVLPDTERRAILTISVNRLHVEVRGLTSLQDELGVRVEPRMLLDKTLESLSWMHFAWSNGMDEHVMKRVRSMTETIDSRVMVRTRGKLASGKAQTIDAAGRLVVDLDGGGLLRLSRGDELVE
jgi:biotin-(acetyl-CoA carboxylase) ligase